MRYSVEGAVASAAHKVQLPPFAQAGDLDTARSATLTHWVDGMQASLVQESDKFGAGRAFHVGTIGVSIPVTPHCNQADEVRPSLMAQRAARLSRVRCFVLDLSHFADDSRRSEVLGNVNDARSCLET